MVHRGARSVPVAPAQALQRASNIEPRTFEPRTVERAPIEPPEPSNPRTLRNSRPEYHRVVKKSLMALTVAAVVVQPPVALDAQKDARAGITEASVKGHLEFLAGDALNGRGSGTRDEWIAASYIASQLRRWGLEPLGDDGGYVQQVDIERSEAAAPPVLNYGGTRLTHGKEMVAQSIAAGRVSGPLQRFQPGVATRPGAVLLLPDPTAPGARSGCCRRRAGAGRGNAADHALFGTAARLPPPTAQLKGVRARRVPASSFFPRRRTTRCSALAEGTSITLTTELKPAQVSHTWNAIGKLTGRDKRRAAEVILLTAHLDHLGNRPPRPGAPAGDTIFNGADDDASGSVAVLELAEALAKGRRPKRTIIFTWFGSEEAGGYGAAYFLEHPPVPLEAIVANLEFEMIGRPDPAVPPHTLWLTGYERSDLGPRLAKRGARLVQDPHPSRELLHALRQHPARPPRRRRADRLELRPAQGVSPAFGRSPPRGLRAHDRMPSARCWTRCGGWRTASFGRSGCRGKSRNSQTGRRESATGARLQACLAAGLEPDRPVA